MGSVEYKAKWEHCDMNICQKCYLQNLKHEYWNILHRLAIIQTKCRIITSALFLAWVALGRLIPDNVYNIPYSDIFIVAKI